MNRGIRSGQLVHLSLFVAAGLVLFLFENLIPRPLPWLKPGLANAAALLALYVYGLRAALGVTILRVVVGASLLGTLLNPAFFLSLGGGLGATLAMGIMKHIGKRAFSIVGISVVGAVCHNATQMLLAYILVVRRSELFFLMPMIVLSAVFTGLVVGLISYLLLEKGRVLLPGANR